MKMSSNEGQDILSAAWAIVDAIEKHELPSRPAYLHPHKMLSALLTHAPTDSGKREIAKDIVDNGMTGRDAMTGLIELTEYFWTALLVPCNPPHSLYSLSYLVCMTDNISTKPGRENSGAFWSSL